jgi:hypothetical protein
VIGDPTLGDAILDRIIHRAHRIDLNHARSRAAGDTRLRGHARCR